MQLDEVLEKIQHPENILPVKDMEDVIDWTTHWIYELELELADLDFICDSELAKLVELHGSVAQGEVRIKLTDVYRQRKKKELTLKTLKSYRTNIRKKQSRLTNNAY